MPVSTSIEVLPRPARDSEWRKTHNSQVTILMEPTNKKEIIIDHKQKRQFRLRKHISLPDITKAKHQRKHTSKHNHNHNEKGRKQRKRYRVSSVCSGLVDDDEMQPVVCLSQLVYDFDGKQIEALQKRSKSVNFLDDERKLMVDEDEIVPILCQHKRCDDILNILEKLSKNGCTYSFNGDCDMIDEPPIHPVQVPSPKVPDISEILAAIKATTENSDLETEDSPPPEEETENLIKETSGPVAEITESGKGTHDPVVEVSGSGKGTPGPIKIVEETTISLEVTSLSNGETPPKLVKERSKSNGEISEPIQEPPVGETYNSIKKTLNAVKLTPNLSTELPKSTQETPILSKTKSNIEEKKIRLKRAKSVASLSSLKRGESRVKYLANWYDKSIDVESPLNGTVEARKWEKTRSLEGGLDNDEDNDDEEDIYTRQMSGEADEIFISAEENINEIPNLVNDIKIIITQDDITNSHADDNDNNSADNDNNSADEYNNSADDNDGNNSADESFYSDADATVSDADTCLSSDVGATSSDLTTPPTTTSEAETANSADEINTNEKQRLMMETLKLARAKLNIINKKNQLLKKCASLASLTNCKQGDLRETCLVNWYEPMDDGWMGNDGRGSNKLPKTLSLDQDIDNIINKNAKAEIRLGHIKLLFDSQSN